MATAAIVTINY